MSKLKVAIVPEGIVGTGVGEGVGVGGGGVGVGVAPGGKVG